MEEVNISNKLVTIKSHINGAPKEADFELITTNIDTSCIKPGSNLVLLKCLLLSMDPYQLNRMKTASPSQNSVAAATQLLPGKAIDGHGIGKVLATGHPGFQKDDLVAGFLTWAEYVVVDAAKLLRKLDPTAFPLSYHLGILAKMEPQLEELCGSIMHLKVEDQVESPTMEDENVADSSPGTQDSNHY